MPFVCHICGEESSRICVRCTKDACNNHLCEKCQRCSDCCECEVALEDQPQTARSVLMKHDTAAEPDMTAGEDLAGVEGEKPEPPEAPEPAV